MSRIEGFDDWWVHKRPLNLDKRELARASFKAGIDAAIETVRLIGACYGGSDLPKRITETMIENLEAIQKQERP